MALQSYQIKVGDRVIICKALKAEVDRFTRVIWKLDHLSSYWKELTGVIGESESSAVLMAMFSAGEGKPREGWQEARKQFVDSVPSYLLIGDMHEAAKKANALFDEWLPVIDKRRSREEQNAENEKHNEIARKMEEEQKREKEEFLAQFSTGELVQVPPGKFPVIAQLSYNDSDAMTDYYHPYHSYGEKLLLGFHGSKIRSEGFHRYFVNRYPELKALNWKFEKQQYSGGGGIFLLSEYTEHKAKGRKSYGGQEEPPLRYEVRIITWDSRQKEYYGFKGYPGEVAQQTEPAAGGNGNGKFEVKINEEKNGVEIHFPERPDQAVLDSLKGNGWRWSKFSRCWYAKKSDEAINFANSLNA